MHRDQVRKKEVCRRIGVVRELTDETKQRVLQWFRRGERRDEKGLMKSLSYRCEVRRETINGNVSEARKKACDQN